jgi:hypothetical protein
MKDADMPDLEREIAAFEAMVCELESRSMGKWVVFHDGKLAGIYDGFEAAAEEAVRRFGRGPYLIRQVGAPQVTLPASVIYHPAYGKDDTMRFQQWAGWAGKGPAS